jgi:acyl-CoA hydrolase
MFRGSTSMPLQGKYGLYHTVYRFPFNRLLGKGFGLTVSHEYRICSISKTVVEAVYTVLPRHANPINFLHGGVALEWIIATSNLAASRVARGPAVLASLDHVFFVSPVRIGENSVLTSWVELVGETSLSLTTLMEAEDPVTGDRRVTTLAHLTMVAVDRNLRPRKVPAIIKPTDSVEEMLFLDAMRRRSVGNRCKTRREDIVRDTARPKPIVPGMALESYRFAYPEDTVMLDVVDASKLLYIMDELAGITGLRYVHDPVVTASVDYTCFYSPIWVGETIQFYSALTFVGKRSLEVTVKVVSRNEITEEERHITTAYFTLVHVGMDGRSKPVPPYEPKSPDELKMASEGEARRRQRMKLLSSFTDRFGDYQRMAEWLRRHKI